MNFNWGLAVTNSEHYYTCDTLWAHFSALRDELRSGDWSTSYEDLECYADTSVNDWLFQKVSNSEHYVVDTSGVTC